MSSGLGKQRELLGHGRCWFKQTISPSLQAAAALPHLGIGELETKRKVL